MSKPSEAMSKKDFLEMTCVVFKEILHPQTLRSALEAAALKLNISEASSIITKMLGPENGAAATEKAGRGKDAADRKEKGKRSLTTYNIFVAWISDFVAHYGRHPTVVGLKNAHPGIKLGMGFASEFYKTISPEAKEAILAIFRDFLEGFEHKGAAAGEGEAAGSALEAFKKFEAQHTEKSIGKILGLEAKPEYKTDPAQMKAEAAEARRNQADGAAAGGPSATPAGAGKPDLSRATQHDHLPIGNGLQMNGAQTPAAPTPATAVKSTGKEKGKGKRKAEEIVAAPVAALMAASPAPASAAAAAAKVEADAEDVSAKKKKKKAKTEEGEVKPKKDVKVKVEELVQERVGPVLVDSAVKSEKKEKKEKKEKEKKDKKEKKEKDKKEKKKDKKEKEKKEH